jgi:transposase InsO family protein
MEKMYEISGISRQGHYKISKRKTARESQRAHIILQVRQARISHPRMGSRPLHKMLKIECVGINQFERLLSSNGMGIKVKRNKRKTTDGHLHKERETNKMNGKSIDGINQAWVSDITYFQSGSKIFYITMIMDIYSRKILGTAIHTDMFAVNTLSVLKASIKSRGILNYEYKLIHHSDKGSQYMSTVYRNILSYHKIEMSVAENSLQNAYAERINGTIKNDYLQFYKTENLTQLRKYLRHTISLYNSHRPHSSLNYMTPEAFELALKNGNKPKK